MDKKKKRVILRLIPEFIEIEELTKLLESYGAGETFKIEYFAPHLPEKMQNEFEKFGRAYLKFNKIEDIAEFKTHFEGESFSHPKNGRDYKIDVEWAPFQHRFELKPRKPDRKSGTMCDSDVYKKFCEMKEREAENMLERELTVQNDGASAADLFGDAGTVVLDEEQEGKENPLKTPIVAFLLAKHEKRKKDKLRERQRRRRKKREKELSEKKRRQQEALEEKEKEKRRRDKKRDQRERNKARKRNAKHDAKEDEKTQDEKEVKIKSSRSRRSTRGRKRANKRDQSNQRSDPKERSEPKKERSPEPGAIPATSSSNNRGRRRKRGRGGSRGSKSRGRGKKRGRGKGTRI